MSSAPPDGLSGEAVAMALLEAARVAYADAMLVTALLGAAIVLIAAVTTIAMFRGLRPATA